MVEDYRENTEAGRSPNDYRGFVQTIDKKENSDGRSLKLGNQNMSQAFGVRIYPTVLQDTRVNEITD